MSDVTRHGEPGQECAEIIDAKLKAAHGVLVLWSDRSGKARYVNGEARVAMVQGRLVPAFMK